MVGAIEWAKKFLGINDDAPKFEPKRKAYVLPGKSECRVPAGPVKAFLEGRGISETTMRLFRIGKQRGGEGWAIQVAGQGVNGASRGMA